MTCDEASQLISLSVDKPLSFMQRMCLQLHLLFCRRCPILRAFVRRLQAKAAEIETADLSEFPSLSEDVKAEIVRKINNHPQSLPDSSDTL